MDDPERNLHPEQKRASLPAREGEGALRARRLQCSGASPGRTSKAASGGWPARLPSPLRGLPAPSPAIGTSGQGPRL